MADSQDTRSWWALDETSGLRAWAWGPVQNHGQYVGSPTLGGVAGGVTMNGTSQHVTVPDHASLDLTGNWALWCQVKRGATGAIRSLVSKGAGAYQLRLDATGTPQLAIAGGAVLVTSSRGALDTGVHTVMGANDGGLFSLWVDGQTAGSASPVATIAANALPLTLGADTTAGGAVQQRFNGTMYAAAVMGALTPGTAGPVILPQLIAGQFLDVPLIRAAYRDPADSSTALVTAPIPVLVLPGRTPIFGLVQWSYAGGGPGATGNLSMDANGMAQVGSLQVAPGQNGTPVQLSITAFDAGSQPQTSWALPVTADVALARLAPNVTLGDNVAGLADSWAMTPAPDAIADGGAVFYRAMTGPAPTDYAPGSAWSSTAAGVQAQLPARGAYLAAQAQLVRRT